MDETERALLIAVTAAVQLLLYMTPGQPGLREILAALEAMETKARQRVEAEHIPLNGR